MADNTDLKDAYYYDEEEKKGGGLGRRILAVFLGFLFGILCTFGAIAGISYYFLKKASVKKVASVVGDLTNSNVNISAYLSEDYAKKSVIDLLSGVIDLADDFKGGDGSLSSFESVLSEDAYRQIKNKISSTLQKSNITLTDEQLDGLLTAPLKNIGKELKTNVLEPLELGELFALAKVDMNDLLVLLCYGEKDVDYTVDENGNYQPKEGGNAFLTIGDLMKSNGTDALMSRLTVSALLKTNGTPDYSSALLRALCFGEENKAFTYDETNGTTFLPLSFTLSEAGDVFEGTNGRTYKQSGSEARWEHSASGEYISTTPPSGAKSTAFGTDTYYLYTKSDEVKYTLKSSSDAYVAYDKNDEVVKNKELTLVDLINIMNDGNDGLVSMFSAVELGELLKLDGSSPKILLALAYGEQGKDYKIESNKIVSLDGGKKPVTFGELTSSADSEKIFNGIKLGSVLTINRDDAAMMGLVYGTEGKHYVFPTEAEMPTMLPVVFRLNGGTLYDDEGTPVTDCSYESGVYTVQYTKRWKKTAETYYAMHPEGAAEGVYYLYASPTEENALRYQEAALGDLTEQSESMINGLDLGSVLGVSPLDDNPNSALLALAYGSEGTHYQIVTDESGNKSIKWLTDPTTGKSYSVRTVSDLRGDNAQKLIDDMKIGQLISVSDDAPVFLNAIKGWTVSDLKDNDKVNGLTLGDVIDIDTSSHKVLQQLADTPINGLSDKLNDLKLEDVIDIDDSSHKVLQALAGTNINDLSGKLNDLTLGDVIDIKAEGEDKSHNVLIALKDTNINDLSSKLGTLTLRQVLCDSVDDNFILKHLASTSLDNLSSDIENLTIQQVFADKIYEKDAEGKRVLTGTWKYLLTVNGEEQEYKISDFDQLVTNMTNNMQKATLNALATDLGIDIDEEFRNKELVSSISVNGIVVKTFLNKNDHPTYFHEDDSVKKFGELNITQLVDYTKYVIGAIESLSTS